MPPKDSLLKATQGEAICNYYHDHHVVQDILVPLYKAGDAIEFNHRAVEVYPIWIFPHRLFKVPVKTMLHPIPDFELHRRQGDPSYAQMCTDIGIWYAPASVLRGEDFDGAEAIRQLEMWLIQQHGNRQLEMWLIQQHGNQARYTVSELTEKNFCRIGRMYEHCRKKYGAIGTFMSVYYRSKKGKKTEEEVQEAEAEIVEPAYSELE